MQFKEGILNNLSESKIRNYLKTKTVEDHDELFIKIEDLELRMGCKWLIDDYETTN
jgi:hypothetical protein